MHLNEEVEHGKILEDRDSFPRAERAVMGAKVKDIADVLGATADVLKARAELIQSIKEDLVKLVALGYPMTEEK